MEDAIFEGLCFVLGSPKEMSSLSDIVAAYGGLVEDAFDDSVTHVVVDVKDFVDRTDVVEKAIAAKIPVVSTKYVHRCVAEEQVLNPTGKFHDENGLLLEEKLPQEVKAAPTGTRRSSRRRKQTQRYSPDSDDTDVDALVFFCPDVQAALSSTKAKASRKRKQTSSSSSSSSSEKKSKKKKTEKKEKKKKSSAKSSAKSAPRAVKLIRKGRAAVDDECGRADSVHVYEENDDVYDVMLNQTNIKNNNNKYYIIQLLEDDDKKGYWLWTRWGRVGKVAGRAMQAMGTNLDKAKKAFCSKFRQKTKNAWADRHDFVTHKGKYTMLERDYFAEDEKNQDEADDEDEEMAPPPSELQPAQQDLIKLIADVAMMNRQMVEIGYDANQLPLGKLSKAHIKRGYKVLTQIAEALEEDASRNKLIDLSDEFYTLIPHAIGMTRLPVIDDEDMLKGKLEMVNQLADIEIATKLLSAEKLDVHPIDQKYLSLNCDLKPLSKGKELDIVKKYVRDTHALTHNMYTLKVEEVFDVRRDAETASFAKYADSDNRQLLWHGSRLSNFMGILSQGLRIAPPEAPVTGYMFGKGVYFADRVSKSANYCHTSREHPTGLLLLCEVAVGTPNKLYHADYNAADLPAGTDSTWGVGKTQPKSTVVMDDGVIVPLGKSHKPKLDEPTDLLYNEFIVYNTDQCRMRYLVRVKFVFDDDEDDDED